MAADLRITGAEDLAALSRKLKAAGEHGKGLRKELLKEIRLAAKDTVTAVKANADTLPKHGGLARRFKRGIGVRTTTGRVVGVRIVAKNGYDVEGINRGIVRHPVFGNRDKWVSQQVPPGWFTNPIEKDEDHLRRSVLDAIDNIAKKLES